MLKPSLGRFVQPDPTGFGGGDENLYRTENNGPEDNLDPSGLQKGPAGYFQATGDGGVAAIVAGFGSIKKANGEWKEQAWDFMKEVKNKYPQLRPEDRVGIMNAVRHAYWQAMITARYGALAATKIGDAHERGGENCIDSKVDQFNNTVGRRIGHDYHTYLIGAAIRRILGRKGSLTLDSINESMDEIWEEEQERIKKEIKEMIAKMVEEAVKTGKGELVIAPTGEARFDPRVMKMPGWRADLPEDVNWIENIQQQWRK
jgi:hypothetical protein